MGLEIVERDTDGVTVLELSGILVRGEECDHLRKKIKDILVKSPANLVLDFGSTRHVDSAGLGTLVASFISARNVGARLKFARLGKEFYTQLHIAKMVTVFEIYPTVEEAVKSSQGGRAAEHS